ncbi:H-type small acid-soluble spore protein [Paenibacillus sp. SYP-B3998]|uniref:H-type small acid-soluble spore protein n=1 Tax=Paenibacillus sp. SYP-B3998 TaxID=2678564 RepID=A0A6G3ZZL5_9BACL|nr:H-type small acid-soluble spore protein [Paenibacillus sp. SYP-B3998]NEW07653.1 H-type small acid-soluble spore protein [Paenibacillus sp. SYP-B3998]
MDIQRANEIAASSVMVNVSYEGVPIYIQHVNEPNEMARIYPLNQPDKEQNVPLHTLKEF